MNMSKGPEVIDDPSAIAIKNLDAKDRETFKNLGKEMYGHLKFKGVDLLNSLEPPDDDLIAYVTRQLDDGMHPSCMSAGEHKVLCEHHGPEWYTRWKYVEGDLTDIVTVDRN